MRAASTAATSPAGGGGPKPEATGTAPTAATSAAAAAETPPPTLPAAARSEPASDYEMQFDFLDPFLRAGIARATLGISPHAVGAAWFDWWLHLARAPGRQLDLVAAAQTYQARLAQFALACAAGETPALPFRPEPGDRRFDAPEWSQQPSCLLAQGHLALESWFRLATAPIHGMAPKHAQRVAFMARQMLDVLSPTNSLVWNPLLRQRTLETGGANLWQGGLNYLEDLNRQLAGDPPKSAEAFRVGRDVAVTPGTVVLRTHLFELIQYQPATPTVHPEPVLVAPAWIMKYYILDLSPQNSLVRFLVGRGHTVYMMSWLNPRADDRDLSLDDYRHAVMTAIDAITAAVPETRVHLAGYCLGGTISAIAAAEMARDNDARLASLTLMAAQTDFSEAGELMLFVDESQIAFLEDMMWAQGVLSGRQMSGAFHLLRSNELVWSRFIRDYLMGERARVIDIQAWSEDLTRMPFRMHSQYLRALFLENRLSAGRFAVDGRVIALQDIEVPMFVVGTESDHIAPWQSVYKVHLFTDNELTFVLTNAGHNAGIVSEPGRANRRYRTGVRFPKDLYRDPQTWAESTGAVEGSWWIAWADWLAAKSSAPRVAARDDAAPRGPLAPLGPAPGRYVLQR